MTETTESLLGSKDKLLASKSHTNSGRKTRSASARLGAQPGTAHAWPSRPSRCPPLDGGATTKSEADCPGDRRGSSSLTVRGNSSPPLRRPPINESQTTDAAWIVLAVAGEDITGPDATDSERQALAEAVAWLDTAKQADLHQDKVFKVLLAVRMGKPPNRADHDRRIAGAATGRWRLEPNRSRTEERRLCNGADVVWSCRLPATRPIALKSSTAGIDFLVATQKPDGSWPTISRSTPDGEPRGFEAPDTHQLCGQLLGHAGPGEPRAEGKTRMESRRCSHDSEGAHGRSPGRTKAAR